MLLPRYNTAREVLILKTHLLKVYENDNCHYEGERKMLQ